MYRRGPWKPCLQAYHGHCDTVPLERDPFPRGLTPQALEESTEGHLVAKSPGLEATDKEKEEYNKQFHAARLGDHLMVPFVCETCHFRNIFGQEARVESPEDKWVVACMVRANLDAFWARRPLTMHVNTQETARMMKQARMFRSSKPLASFPRGPFPLSDGFGMLPAVMSLLRSLDKGRNSRTIQWDTMQGLRTTYSNFIHTTPDGLGGSVLSDGRKNTRITLSPANSLWFQRFMDGCHERMGDVSIPDAALAIDTLLELEQVIDKIWLESRSVSDREMMHETATIGCAIICGYSASLRGEELGHIRLRESLMLTTQGLKHTKQKHIVLALEGRFKGQTARKKHKVPLVLTSASGIPNFKWLMRLFESFKAHGETYGPLLWIQPTDSSAARVSHLDVWFHKYLLMVQDSQTGAITEHIDVINRYCMRRLLCRGSTTQARNKRVPKDVVDLNNRWRTEDHAGHQSARGSEMLQVYTEVVAALETLLQFSAAL